MFDEDDTNLMIDFEYNIKLIRLMDNNFVFSNISLRAEVIPVKDEIDHESFEVALSKCRFWLDTVVSKSIAFCIDNEQAIDMLFGDCGHNKCSNFIMLTPFEPTDDHIAGLIQSKLTALSSGYIAFGSIRVKSDNSSGLMFRFTGDADDLLPDMKEWIGEHSFFDVPWWNRDDASTLDVVPPKDADLSVKPAWAYKLDFLENAIRSVPQEVVVRPDFKPKIISGGKDG